VEERHALKTDWRKERPEGGRHASFGRTNRIDIAAAIAVPRAMRIPARPIDCVSFFITHRCPERGNLTFEKLASGTVHPAQDR